jgi:hypothetical protein
MEHIDGHSISVALIEAARHREKCLAVTHDGRDPLAKGTDDLIIV